MCLKLFMLSCVLLFLTWPVIYSIFDHKQNSLMLERVSVMHSAIRACMVGDRPRVHSAIHAATNGHRNLHCLGIGIGEGPFEQASEDGYSAGSGHAPVLCAYPPILSHPILMYYCHKTSKADHLIKPPGHTNGKKEGMIRTNHSLQMY